MVPHTGCILNNTKQLLQSLDHYNVKEYNKQNKVENNYFKDLVLHHKIILSRKRAVLNLHTLKKQMHLSITYICVQKIPENCAFHDNLTKEKRVTWNVKLYHNIVHQPIGS